MTQLNGSPPPDPFQDAKLRFARAYALAKAPQGQLQFNPMQVLIEIEVLKINLGVLIAMACSEGMDGELFNQASIAQLNAQAEGLEGPRLAVVPAGVLGRKR